MFKFDSFGDACVTDWLDFYNVVLLQIYFYSLHSTHLQSNLDSLITHMRLI